MHVCLFWAGFFLLADAHLWLRAQPVCKFPHFLAIWLAIYSTNHQVVMHSDRVPYHCPPSLSVERKFGNESNDTLPSSRPLDQQQFTSFPSLIASHRIACYARITFHITSARARDVMMIMMCSENALIYRGNGLPSPFPFSVFTNSDIHYIYILGQSQVGAWGKHETYLVGMCIDWEINQLRKSASNMYWRIIPGAWSRTWRAASRRVMPSPPLGLRARASLALLATFVNDHRQQLAGKLMLVWQAESVDIERHT